MTDRCQTCRFSRAYAPPKGERPAVPPEPKRKWWETFGPPPLLPIFTLMRQADWDGAKRRAEKDVRCQRFPDAQQKHKTDWCGEYRAKAKKVSA